MFAFIRWSGFSGPFGVKTAGFAVGWAVEV